MRIHKDKRHPFGLQFGTAYADLEGNIWVKPRRGDAYVVQQKRDGPSEEEPSQATKPTPTS